MPLLAAKIVQLGQQRRRRQRLAVDRDRIAALEADLDVGRLVGRVLRRDGALVDALGGSTPGLPAPCLRTEECSRLASTENGASPRLSLATGIWCFSAKSISVGADLSVPLAPRRDHLDVGLQRRNRPSSKRTWSLPLPVAPWATASAPVILRDLDLALGDQRPGDRGAEQVLALIERIGAEHREDEVAHEFLAQILDEDVLGLMPISFGLLARAAPVPRPGPDRR
jgi:hypothetical protein